MAYVRRGEPVQIQHVDRQYKKAIVDWTRFWLWILRLSLPVIIALAGQVLYWMWFDHSPGEGRWWSVIGTIPLGFGTALVSLWAFSIWMSEPT
jgi:hypothetical protein